MVRRNQKDGYEEIIVGSGETFYLNLADTPSFTNKVIDITATGASYDINSGGASNWEFRNVGFRGQIDAQGAPTQQNFVVYDPSSSGQSVIENVYHPGTSYSRGNPENFPSGIFVYTDHAGDLQVNNYYAKDLPSHALYGSTMAADNGGARGTVRVHDSFCRDTENSGWRLGSQGSYADNCVAFRTVRGIWARWGPVEAYDCDLGNNTTDIVASDGGSLTADNCRYGTTSGSVSGSSVGQPEERIPAGCPTSPEEAAKGGGSGGGGSIVEYDNTVRIRGQGQACQYEITFSGEWKEDPSHPLEQYDDVSGDTVTGYVTETSHVDGFKFNGPVDSFRFLQSEATITLNGSEVTVDELLAYDGGGSAAYNEPTCVRDFV